MSSGLLSGCGKTSAAQPVLTPVRTSEVRIIDSGSPSTYSANIAPYAQVDLAFKSNGYLASLRQVRGADGRMRSVGEGDRVAKGTVLATVQQDDYQQRLTQSNQQLARSQADYDRARLSFDRTSTLFKDGAATKPDYDNANAQMLTSQAAVESAKSSIAEANLALDYCQLKTPFDAWVIKRGVEVGQLVGPATNGFTVADTRSVKAVFGVPDTAFGRIKLGSIQTVRTDAVPGPFMGRVTAISPAADAKSRVYSVEVTIPNAANRLKSGMIASIALAPSQPIKKVTVVPLSAVIKDPNQPNGFAVFVTDSSGETPKVHTQSVHLGDAYGNLIAVASGVAPGQRVVTSGSTMIRPGDEVRVIP